MAPNGNREAWGTRLGIILAAAGSAVGIGNLLRFPGQAATHGGGTFMIPYVVSMLLLGLPIMWIAWTVGRMGGRHGHGSLPGMYDKITGRWWGKYVGVIGVALPLVFIIYYTYIEAWCLAYAWFSATGSYADPSVDLGVYFQEFLGNATTSHYFPGVGTALVFLGISLLLNVWILYRGVSKGIEALAKIAIPILMLFSIVLGVWVLSQGPAAWAGLDFLWTPDFSKLTDPDVWLAAAGQIFFTLTLGYGALECFGSYLKDDDDLVLTGLTAASLNEFVEVIFGSMIAIPAAALYFGSDKIVATAESGTFAIGMISMPEIFRGMEGIQLFGSMWFLLLFFAAFTSSVAVAQPVMAFLQDEARMSRGVAAIVLFFLWVLGSIPVVFFYKYGALDDMDFWAGTVGLVICATMQALIFSLILGVRRGWDEMHKGAEIRIPRIFKPIMAVVTPLLLVALTGAWFFDAIMSDSMLPHPKIVVGFEHDGDVRGRFLFEEPEEGTPEHDELVAIEERLRNETTRRREDIAFDLHVTLNAVSAPVLSHVRGEEALLRTLPITDLRRWVSLKGARYEKSPSEPMRSYAVVMKVESRYTSTAIWITRFLMLAINAGFLVMIHTIWKNRESSGEVSA